ncbi:hypothetical protein HY629_02625, partial [Candidatus Uhrbacteria bacterium]|nr:hypothetical protein [Candidatus Uhrbacteria bacterium]
MVYTNTVQRTMIWGLVGLLVVSALPLNSAFAQTSDTTKPVIASVAKVLTSDNKNQLYINYTPIEELSPRVYVQYATTVDGVASAGAIPYASGEVIVIPKPNYPTLTSGARYYFRVQAVDAANNYSDWYPTTSNQASSYFDVPNTKPSAPAWMSLTYYSESQFFASLPQRSDNTQYHLRYRASGPITNLTEYTSTSNEQSFSAQSGETIVTVPDAMKGGMIYGAVRACNPAPDNCSDAVTAGQVLIGAPTAPASLTATLDAAAPNTTVKLSWTVPTSKIGTHQTIKRRTTTNPAAWTEAEWDSADYVTQVNLPSTDAGMAKTFTVSTGLTSGSTYVFGIRGYTSSHITAPKSAIVVTSPVTLVAPTPTPTPTPSPTSTPGASAPEPLNDESGVWAQVDIASGQVLSSAICKKSVCGINGEYHGYVPPASYTTGSVWWPTSKRYIWQLPGQAGYGSGTFNFSTYVFTVTGGTIYNGVFTPTSTSTPTPTPTATASPTATPAPNAPVLSSIVHAVNAGGSATI